MKIEDDSRMAEIDAEEAMVLSVENQVADIMSAFLPANYTWETFNAGLNDHLEPFVMLVITRTNESEDG